MTKFEDCKKKWLEEAEKEKQTIESVSRLYEEQRKFGNSFKFPSRLDIGGVPVCPCCSEFKWLTETKAKEFNYNHFITMLYTYWKCTNCGYEAGEIKIQK